MSTDMEVFTTIRRIEGDGDCLTGLTDFFKKSDELGFQGSLIFQNNSNDIEPWISAQSLLAVSKHASPLIAVNPVYMHPITVAQKIYSLTKLYGRRIYINFIIGTAISDLDSINGNLQHADRYERLIEYITIILHLLGNSSLLKFNGKYFSIRDLRLPQIIDQSLFPKFFIAGSSVDAQNARVKTNAHAMEMAKPINGHIPRKLTNTAINFGIIADETTELARNKLSKEFAAEFDDIEGIMEITMSNTDSVWKNKLLNEREDDVYCLQPLRNMVADCPYLVGSYKDVSDYIDHYIQSGVSTLIIESTENDLMMIGKVIQMLNV